MQKSTAEPSANGQRLSWATVLGFGQLAVPLATAGLPVAVYVTRFYASDLKLSIGDVGMLLLLARIADIIVDPVIGFLSDHTRWGLGRRRTWILLGVPVFMLGTYMLFLPPASLIDAAEDTRRFYLLGWIAVFYLGWTMITIPYGAWGAELSGDYNERSRITGIREIFTLIGLALAGVTAVVVGAGAAEGAAAGAPGSTGLSNVMAALGIIIVAITPIGAAILYWTSPEPAVKEMHHISFWKGVKVAATNWSFARLFLATILLRMGSRAVEGLLVFYLVDAVGLAEQQARQSLLVLLVSAILFAPFWIWAGRHWTKHRALAIAMGFGIGVFAVLPLLTGLGYWPNMIAFFVLGTAFSAPFTLGQSMAADVIDLDSLKTRQPRAGLLISFFGIALKSDGLGLGLALVIVGQFGYVSAAAVKSAAAVQALTWVFVLFPALLWLPAIALLWNFPITPEVQKRIRRLIDRRIAIEDEVHKRRQAAHKT